MVGFVCLFVFLRLNNFSINSLCLKIHFLGIYSEIIMDKNDRLSSFHFRIIQCEWIEVEEMKPDVSTIVKTRNGNKGVYYI